MLLARQYKLLLFALALLKMCGQSATIIHLSFIRQTFNHYLVIHVDEEFHPEIISVDYGKFPKVFLFTLFIVEEILGELLMDKTTNLAVLFMDMSHNHSNW